MSQILYSQMEELLINSPLDQFEVVSLVMLVAPLFNGWVAAFTIFSLFSILVTYLTLALHYYGDNEFHLVPSRWSIALESIFSTVSLIVREQVGEAYEVYLPFIYSLFFFVLIANLTGNIPYTFTLGTSVISSIGLSFTIIVGVTILGLSRHQTAFFSLFVPAGTPLALVPLLVMIEMVSYAARAVSLGVRLFSNMVAGHTLLAILSGFMYSMFGAGALVAVVTLVPFAIFVAIVGLELAVSFIQAYVFVLLTASYLKDALDLH